jgi:hypothetical protein
VTASEVNAITDKIGEALTNKTLTREELSQEVSKLVSLSPEVRKHLRSGWSSLLKPAAYQGLLFFGESEGARVTFTGPAPWVCSWKETPSNEALTELFRRYLSSYGPITVDDFGRWWGGLRAHDKRVIFDGLAGSWSKLNWMDSEG